MLPFTHSHAHLGNIEVGLGRIIELGLFSKSTDLLGGLGPLLARAHRSLYQQSGGHDAQINFFSRASLFHERHR